MIKFQPKFTLPELLLEFKPLNNASLYSPTLDNEISAKSSDYIFSLSYSNVNPTPVKFETEENLIIIIGAPIIEDKIDFNATFSLINSTFKESNPIEGLNNINGEFIIIHFDKETSKLSIINDRFTSTPLFYSHNEQSKQFYASTYFSSIWDFLKKSNLLKIDKNAFFEFLWFQRLLGTKTYAKNCYFLEDASLLTLNDNNFNIKRYWTRDYSKSNLSLNKHAQLMTDFLRHSVTRKTSDDKRFGHFLSGGMDSRCVVGAFQANPPVCFTATIGENREFRKAEEIAAVKNAKHIGLELDPEHFGKIYRHSTKVIGGMYNYDHGLFYGFEDVVKDNADVCFHGHGFDYMFQGMYIPKRNIKIAGRHIYLNFLKKLPEDLVSYFINNVSYRIKNANIWSFIKEKNHHELKEFQHNSINEILNQGKSFTNDLNDLWEYLTFHHISRHYSYPNHASIATFAEQRTAAFDNDLFDLYLKLPVNHRINGKIEKAALKKLDPKLAKIWSANTNLPVTASCWTQTAYQLAGFVKRRIILSYQKNKKQSGKNVHGQNVNTH